MPLNPFTIMLELDLIYSFKSINHCAPSGLTIDMARFTFTGLPLSICLRTSSEYHCWNFLQRNSFAGLLTDISSG